MKETRKPLDGKLAKDCRSQFLKVRKDHPELATYQISKESGVARYTIDRIESGDYEVKDGTWDKLGDWIKDKGY